MFQLDLFKGADSFNFQYFIFDTLEDNKEDRTNDHWDHLKELESELCAKLKGVIFVVRYLKMDAV